MGVVPRRAALAVALAAVFSLGAMPLNLSAAAPPSPPPAQAGGTYQQPQDGQAATPAPNVHRAANAYRPKTAPHHVQKSNSSSDAAPVRVVTVKPRPAPKSATSGAAPSTGNAGSTTAFDTTNSITRSDQVNYDGLDVAPPDTQIATGPTANVEVVNDLGSITIRGQAPIQTFFDLNYFFLGTGYLTFIVADPKIVYDALAGRWYMTVTSFDSANDSMVFLAVSQTSDPTARWWVYRILDLSKAQVFCDQPHLGFSADNIVVTCDYFNANGFLIDTGYMILGKGGATAGRLYEYVRYFGNQAAAHAHLQPVYSMTPTYASLITPATSVEYLVYFNGLGLGVLGVWGNVQIQSVGWGESIDQLGTAPQHSPPPAAQSGGTFLDSGDYRIFSAVIRNNLIWFTSADACTPAGDTAQRACMRIDQVDVTHFPHPAVTLDYDIATVGSDLIYPAITLDRSDVAYLAYTSTSASGYPEFDIADILPATPGQVDQAFQIVQGFAPYAGPALFTGGPMRWGDYSGAAPDPNDAHGVVLAGEYAQSPEPNNWGTQGGLFRVPPCNFTGVSFSQSNPFYPGPAVVMQATAQGCWGAPQFRFWKRAPNGGWTIAQDYGVGSTWTWDSSKETVLGTYTFEIDARSQGFITPYDTLTSFSLTLASPTSCSNTSTLNPVSPAATGSTVQVSAASDCPDPIYRFWVKPPGGSWAVARPYAASSTFNWSATGAPGNYNLEVDVKDRLDPASVYGFPKTMNYQLQGCTGATLSANPAQPSRPGATVQMTAGATCLGTPEYRFWVRPPGGAWAIRQDFGPASTFGWTAGPASGTYALEVDVRDHGASASYESVATLSYTVSSSPCAPGISASPAPPGATGSGATFTASVQTPAGCPNPRYRFWLQPPGGAWSLTQDYGAPNTFIWKGAGAAGTYRVEVDARDASETVAYDATATMAYQLSGCSSAGISANLPSGQPPGTAVDLTGTATCPGTPAYRFWIKAPGATWQVKQDYSTSPILHWSSPSAPGSYAIEADVRNNNATSGYEAVANMTFVLGVLPCTTPALTANNPSPQPSGSQFTLTATTNGCPNPVYRFWRKPPGGAWYTSGYGTLNTYTDCCFNAGTANFEVDVKDQSEVNVAYDAVAMLPYDFVPCSQATLTAAPLQAPQGPVINVVGGAYCPGDINPQFRFWYKAGAGGHWILGIDYPQGVNNYMWVIAGHPPGTYYFEVDVRNQGTSVAYETTAVIAYTLSP